MRYSKALRTQSIVLLGTLLAISAHAEANTPQVIEQVLRDCGFETSQTSTDTKPPSLSIVSASQDYAKPTADRCCHTLTPLRVGEKTFEKGIGAHANGRIEIQLNDPFARFTAAVGIDNNNDTAGNKGSVEFIVLVDGAERFHSPLCRGGDAPVPVDVDLSGAKMVELLIRDAGDGINYDQADWADAVLAAKDGSKYYLSDSVNDMPGKIIDSPPTVFIYNDTPCWQLFPTWKHTTGTQGAKRVSAWTEPNTGFTATLTAEVHPEPASVELQWHFANAGSSLSGVISAVDSIHLSMPAGDHKAVLWSGTGGTTGTLENSPGFAVTATPLGRKVLTVEDGRSSNGDLPFYMVTGLSDAWGVVSALGWSGQWKAEGRFENWKATFVSGMDPVHFRLPSGTSISMPTALLIPFQGDERTGSNLLRSLLRNRYQAHLDGKPVDPPVSFNSWFTFTNKVNEPMLKELASLAAPTGIEYFCLDAGWFDGDFPYGVGNWTVNVEKFPNGLKPLADHVHSLGMKFGLWFEPERVSGDTRWAREHSDLLLGGTPQPGDVDYERHIMDLGNPAVRTLILDMMSNIISEVGVDWIRYDFNANSLRFWTRAEGEEEKGLKQALYINGLYEMLDELMRRHPGLLIEQCSSGGRRIDLETIRRGHTFWKSDDTMDQALMRFHETGANVFLPGGLLNTNYCKFNSEGEVLALFAGPLAFGLDYRTLAPEQTAFLTKAVAAYKTVRSFINEDYYPLFDQDTSRKLWNGWQFIDPETGNGFFTVYRQPASPYASADVKLSGLNTGATYTLEDVMSGKQTEATGSQLESGYTISLHPGTAHVCRFSPQK
ncbi:MAG: alpha-galactosidase [Candidatus Hydrogenedentes bacterium]|nr:alpha-galactosidase [Candidatus Hydrogenedentota bacterium]